MKAKELLEKLQWDGLTEEYLLTLGAAGMFFSHAEWIAACCCGEKYLTRFGKAHNKTTAGDIACELVRRAKRLNNESEYKEPLLNEAQNFKSLVDDERNKLLHSYPTTIDGDVVLYKPQLAKSYGIAALEDYLEKCYDCWHELLTIYNECLKSRTS